MKKQWPLDTAVSFDPYAGEPSRDGDQGYEILEGGKVFFRIKAPNAKEVAIDQFGNLQMLTKVDDERWEGTVSFGEGFKYFFLKIDQVLKAVWCVIRLRSGKWIKKIKSSKEYMEL